MALWVLHEKCYGQEGDPEIKCAFEMDPTFLDIRVNNLILPLAKVPNAQLAATLCRLKEKREVANLIAWREFEALIRMWRRVGPNAVFLPLLSSRCSPTKNGYRALIVLSKKVLRASYKRSTSNAI
jgi:hypothetical protein